MVYCSTVLYVGGRSFQKNQCCTVLLYVGGIFSKNQKLYLVESFYDESSQRTVHSSFQPFDVIIIVGPRP